MNKTSTKTLITLLVVLISFIFIVEFTSPIQSINIGHLQKRQNPTPPPNNPPPKDNPPPPPKDNPPPPPKDNPPPPPKDNPTPAPPPPESPAPPKDNPTPAPQPAPETTPNPNVTPPAPDPNATPTPAPSPNVPAPNPNATPPTPDPNATPTPTPSPSAPAPNPNATPPTPDPNAPKTNPITTGPSSSPNSGVSSISPPPVSQSNTTSYLPGREPCTKSDDPRCERGTTDPTVISTTSQNEIITQPSTPPAAPTNSQPQLAPNPKKSTITQFTTYTTTETSYFPGYSTVTSSTGTNGELTTYATYIPPSTVVVVKKVTSAKVEEIQETNPSSAGHLDLELSVYNLYSVATSLLVIAVTMLYLIVA